MHRTTPLHISFRSYYAGGSKSVVESADDSKLMQEMKGSGLKNQSHDKVESPQNYGFTSVVMDADKDEDGNVTHGAETTLNYMGGSTSLPMAGAMDDRRHRLKELGKGDSAMFRTKDDRQQFHLADDGNYMSARSDRRQRIALVPPPEDEDKKQQQGGRSPSVSAQASGSGGGSGGGSSGGTGGDKKKSKEPTGQKSALDDNKKSEIYYDQSGSESVNRHGQAHSSQRPGDSTTFFGDRKKSTQTTDDHTHLRTMDFRIFTDKEGCWSELPIQVKKDRYCKE